MSVAEVPRIPAHPKARPPAARILFDESHSEAWTIRPELAARMQPAHPGDSSLAAAAALLADHGFDVAAHRDGPLSADTLAGAAALVIAHPSEPEWEATVGAGTPRFAATELDVIESFVRAGGGLIVLAETEHAKYGNNLNDLLTRFGIRIENATVQDYEHHHGDAPSWVLAEPAADTRLGPPPAADLLAGVERACFYRAGTLALENGARPLARAHDSATAPGAALAAAATHGAGRVAVCADSDLFGDDCITDLDHERLWLNLAHWSARRALALPREAPPSQAVADPAWAELKAAAAELRETQRPDGSIDTTAHDPERLRELCTRIAAAARALLPRFPHQHDYINALAADLVAWADAGFTEPAFDRATEAFRPERERRDGAEHLCVMPMYKQNASRDTRFEALIVRVRWPEWVAALERERYDNAKFLPVNLLDNTAGYDSECAVLFPETFATAERPPAHFGAIFCDREAERLRRVAATAADVLRLNLPPAAANLLASPQISEDAYVLWDLIHDRTHMRGDLPFDPFMIRQRSPYWMYALEELRCDLTAYGEAVALEAEGFTFARNVADAILLDRLFRFPLTGPRVRNYDGLGGQLLFAFLHRERYLHWTDNRLTIDWARADEGVARLRAKVAELYHSGIDRPKLAQWIAAHDLVAAYVPADPASVWAAERRDLPDASDPKQLVDLVRDDEFPLSLFYTQLRPKLSGVLDGRPL